MSSAPSTFSSICFEQGCWFKVFFFVFAVSHEMCVSLSFFFNLKDEFSLCFQKEGERKIRGVGEKLVVKRRPSSSMSFRVSANNIALKRIIRIGLLGASGYTGAEVHSQLVNFILNLCFF